LTSSHGGRMLALRSESLCDSTLRYGSLN
jgi:hypothetical protein